MEYICSFECLTSTEINHKYLHCYVYINRSIIIHFDKLSLNAASYRMVDSSDSVLMSIESELKDLKTTSL